MILLLSHLNKPGVVIEKSSGSLVQPRSRKVERGFIHKIFYFSFGESDDSATINKIKLLVWIKRVEMCMVFAKCMKKLREKFLLTR